MQKKCECGCGKVFETARKDRKYYNEACKKRAKRNRNKDDPRKKKYKEWNKLSAKSRWKMMTLAEVSTECLRLHLSYGQLQVMAENGTLPKDFGKGCR